MYFFHFNGEKLNGFIGVHIQQCALLLTYLSCLEEAHNWKNCVAS